MILFTEDELGLIGATHRGTSYEAAAGYLSGLESYPELKALVRRHFGAICEKYHEIGQIEDNLSAIDDVVLDCEVSEADYIEADNDAELQLFIINILHCDLQLTIDTFGKVLEHYKLDADQAANLVYLIGRHMMGKGSEYSLPVTSIHNSELVMGVTYHNGSEDLTKF